MKKNQNRKYGKLSRRVTLIFVITMFIAMAFVSLITVTASMEGAAIIYNEYVSYCVSNMVSPNNDNIDEWIENGPDFDYDVYMRYLDYLKEEYQLQSVSVFIPSYDGEGNLINEVSVLYDSESRYQFGEKLSNLTSFSALEEASITGKPAVYNRAIIRPSASIAVIAYAPIRDSADKIVGFVGIELNVMRFILARFFILFLTYVVIHIFGIIPILIIQFFIVRPIKILSRHMNEFVAEEDKLQFTPVTEIQTKDEIEQMADDFNALAQRVLYYTENLEIKTAEEQRLRLDLDVAGQIRQLISSETTYPAFPERTDFDLCASMKHTIYNKCSFCNYFFTDTDRLFIVVGESLGNTLASMIFSILALSSIRSYAKIGLTPYQIAAETNNQLCSTEKKDSDLTVGAVIVDIDLKTGMMRYVNAGMPPLLIKKAGESFKLEKTNLPFSLGQMRGVSFEESTLQLSQGNAILFTSFGVSEMRDSSNKKYSMERLVDKVNQITQQNYALNEIISTLEEDIEQFRGDAPVTLDTALLGFRYFG